jgi:N-acetylglucosamine kinase-like BadF-type ATPase
MSALDGCVLGIDQGGSHTWAVVADTNGELLAVGRAPGACHAFQGLETALNSIQSAASEALQGAGLLPSQVRQVVSGMTGADWADEYPMLENAIRGLGICQRVCVENDAIIALRGGTARKYGAILIAGSGGNCAVRAPDGREFIYGYFYDAVLQGGGALSRRTLELVYRAYTFREPPTRLTERVLAAFQLDSVEALMRADVEGRLPSRQVLDLALVLFDECEAGDPAAVRIVRSFAEATAEAAVAALRHFDMTGLEMDVVLSGSIYKTKSPLLIDTLSAAIRAEAPRARLVNARYEPVVGAVLLGLEKLGVELDAAVLERVDRSACRLGLIRPGLPPQAVPYPSKGR